MGGGLMQLVAYGAQDIYLTGNPQITFFKVVYRRHTNFSMEAIQQTFNGSLVTGESVLSSTISRNGDLIHNMWLDVVMKIDGLNRDTSFGGASIGNDDTYVSWTNNTGHALVKECEIEIGGQLIDRHYSQWLDINTWLTDKDKLEFNGLNIHSNRTYMKTFHAPSKKSGRAEDWGTLGLHPNTHLIDTDPEERFGSGNFTMFDLQLYIPLKFWFCRNPGLALPLIALQYHEVKFNLTTRNIDALINTNVERNGGSNITEPPEIKLYVDYIYLDTDERRRFAQVSHEYLIEQVQSESNTYQETMSLNFNHPVKELIWVNQDDNVVSERTIDGLSDYPENTSGINLVNGNDYFNYMSNEHLQSLSSHRENISEQYVVEAFDTMKLQLNGHDRFEARKASYFRNCQPVQAGHKCPEKHIYCYSFALKPEEHQPSGTCNFSRIDDARIIFSNAPPNSGMTVTVYAINYNVLRIMSGMGGLAYSN